MAQIVLREGMVGWIVLHSGLLLYVHLVPADSGRKKAHSGKNDEVR